MKISYSYIYLLQEREFIARKLSIYKIGKTRQYNCKRFAQYPKSSKLFMQISVNDCDTIEKMLIKIFNKKFTKRLDIGREYYQGNVKEMMSVIAKFCLLYENKQNSECDICDIRDICDIYDIYDMYDIYDDTEDITYIKSDPKKCKEYGIYNTEAYRDTLYLRKY